MRIKAAKYFKKRRATITEAEGSGPVLSAKATEGNT